LKIPPSAFGLAAKAFDLAVKKVSEA